MTGTRRESVISVVCLEGTWLGKANALHECEKHTREDSDCVDLDAPSPAAWGWTHRQLEPGRNRVDRHTAHGKAKVGRTTRLVEVDSARLYLACYRENGEVYGHEVSTLAHAPEDKGGHNPRATLREPATCSEAQSEGSDRRQREDQVRAWQQGEPC
jgi:hypothetical protein